ncbi:UDP-galactose transporter [Metarhizium acridum]|nr:UDP-galactose transporter [Metarhizium acridum]
MMSTLVTGLYLLTSPYLVATGIGEWLGMDVAGSAGELTAALDFMRRYPAVWKDVLGFAACGAIGQVFIFYTLSTFSSVLLVTVTVTRKMFTMILSVVAFWPPPHSHAVARRWSRFRRNRCRSGYCQAGEDGKEAAKKTIAKKDS